MFLPYAFLALITGVSSVAIGIAVAAVFFPGQKNVATALVSGALILFVLIAALHSKPIALF